MINNFKGTGAALITPFKNDFTIDFEGLKKLINHVSADGGANFLTVLGTTGETATLTDTEKAEILAFVKANNVKNLPIMYGLGGNDTLKVLETIKKTNFEGIQSILSVCPYYNKPSQEGIYRHYIAIADASPVPVMLYNIPGRSGVNMTAETTIRLSQHPNIFGMKEASGDLMQCIEIKKGAAKGFILTAGDDLLSVPMIAIGAEGSVSVMSNLFPVKFNTMVNAAMKGDFIKANLLLHDFLEINPLLYLEGNPVGAKYILSLLNICNFDVRLPLAPASNELQVKLKKAFDNFKN
jgi:4-hydroxy-tetrahydrodipicolinate synthase